MVDGGASEVEAGEGEGQGLDPWRNNREFDTAIEGLREAWGTVQQRKSAGSIQVSCILFIQVLYYIIFCIIYIYIYILMYRRRWMGEIWVHLSQICARLPLKSVVRLKGGG